MIKQLWDDDAFKGRVKALAKKRGLSLKTALEAAGLDRGWLRYTPKGRMTNHVMKLARVLDVSFAELLGLDGSKAMNQEELHEYRVRIVDEIEERVAQICTLEEKVENDPSAIEEVEEAIADLHRFIGHALKVIRAFR